MIALPGFAAHLAVAIAAAVFIGILIDRVTRVNVNDGWDIVLAVASGAMVYLAATSVWSYNAAASRSVLNTSTTDRLIGLFWQHSMVSASVTASAIVSARHLVAAAAVKIRRSHLG